MPVRRKLFIPLILLAWALVGCHISRRIVDIKPPPQPRLQNLESHLDYVDPDEGRPDYVIK